MKLYLLGPLRVEIEGQPRLLTGSPAALLGFLGLQEATGYAATRTRLAGTLWPDVDEERARHLLSNSLYRLRRQLGTAVSHLYIAPDSIALQDIWLDITTFRHLLSREDVASWLAALNLYTADLLEELDHFWLLSQRAELRELYLTTLQRSCNSLMAQNKLAEALTVALRWTVADSLNEAAHATVIQLYTQLGRYAAALQQYDTLVQLLADELGVAPLPETQALVNNLRQQRAMAGAAAMPSKSLIGRQAARGRLLTMLEHLNAGHGRLLLLEGAAGIGKTRLLQATAEAAEWRQIRAAWGKTAEHASPEHFAPLPAALQEVTVGPLLDWLASQLTPLIRSLLTPLLPRMNNGSVRSSVFLPEEESSKLPLATAVAKLLTLLCQSKPTLIVLDDVQWADDAFWELLPALAQVTQEQSLLLILSYRSRELRQNRVAWTAVQQADRDIPLERLLLTGFSADELAEFAEQLGSRLSANEQMQLHQLSGGNPLVVKELLLSDNPTASFAKLLHERLAQLGQNERNALFAAAVLGRTFRYSTWQAMLEVPIIIQPLLNGRFLQETVDGYTFRHDLMRAACYQSQSEAERQEWHQRAGLVLLHEGCDPATLAWHFEEGEQWETAVHYHRRAAQRAIHLQDMASAQAHCQKALHCLAKTTDAVEALPLRCLHLHIQQHLAWASTRLEDAQALVQQARQENDLDSLLQTLLLTLNYLVGQGQLDELQAVAEELIQLARDLSNREAEIQALNQVAHALLLVFGDAEKAIGYSERALALAKRLPQQPYLQAQALFTLIHGELLVRERSQARTYLAQVEALFAEHAALESLQAELIHYQAIMAQLDVQWEKARSLQHQLIKIHRADHNIKGLTNALYNAAHIASFIGQHTEAVLFAEEVMLHTSQNRAAADRYLGMFDRTMLLECYTMAGQLDAAEETAVPLLSWLHQEDAGRGAIQAWMAIGNLRFMQGKLEAAYHAHSRALVHIEHRGSSTSAPYICHAEAAFLAGKQAEAEASFAKATTLIDLTHSGSNLTYYRYVQFLLTGELQHLQLAREQMVQMVNLLENPRLRREYWYQMPVHQDIERRWQTAVQSATVQLAGADVSLGRPLTADDRLLVIWTMDAGVLDEAILQTVGKVGLRRFRLQRLLAEAIAQGTLPTDADLAQAVHVSIRTIERDRVALAAEGFQLVTRGYGRSP